jgi:hypothetical protein
VVASLESRLQDWNQEIFHATDIDNKSEDLIAKTVEDFRLQRLSMVQTLRQFVLCYETVLQWTGEWVGRNWGTLVAYEEGLGVGKRRDGKAKGRVEGGFTWESDGSLDAPQTKGAGGGLEKRKSPGVKTPSR